MSGRVKPTGAALLAVACLGAALAASPAYAQARGGAPARGGNPDRGSVFDAYPSVFERPAAPTGAGSAGTSTPRTRVAAPPRAGGTAGYFPDRRSGQYANRNVPTLRARPNGLGRRFQGARLPEGTQYRGGWITIPGSGASRPR